MKNHKFLEYNEVGFTIFESFFSEKEVDLLQQSIKELSNSKEVTLYKDRSGKLRRMEQFTFKDEILNSLNERVSALLFGLTGDRYELFKDKVNFKPANGEGFFAHYDGIFQFQTQDGITKNGWYEYASEFDNVLITLDDFTQENGALEVAKQHLGDFDTLLKNTKLDGSPDLKDSTTLDCDFFPLICSKGSVIFFKHSCPHRSGPNRSKFDRGSIYFTYTKAKHGSFYEEYFKDKEDSKNKNKALSGEEA